MIIKLRNDLKINFNEIVGNEFFIYDDFNLVINKLSIPFEYKEFIDLLIVGLEYNENKFYINKKLIDTQIDINILSQIIIELDKFLFLDNDKSNNKLKEITNYNNLKDRPNVCENILYSSDTIKFRSEIHNIIKQNKLEIKRTTKSDNHLILAPHLDYFSNTYVTESYANIFYYIGELEYDLVVYLGTAHFVNSSLFMFCDKNYSTPLKNTFTDGELINKILDDASKTLINIDILNKNNNITNIDKYIKIDNIAHKNEHSIELHNTFISYLKNNNKVNILPILTGSFDEKLNPQIYNNIVEIIKNNIKLKYKKVLFLSSGDMSHIGVKFGDLSDKSKLGNKISLENQIDKNESNKYYSYKKENYINFEKGIINSLINNNLNEYKTKMFLQNKDFRICGFAPFYSALCFFPELKGTLINHNFTENLEDEFLVSFITMIFT